LIGRIFGSIHYSMDDKVVSIVRKIKYNLPKAPINFNQKQTLKTDRVFAANRFYF